MPELDPKIAELEARLDSLVRTQIDFQTEVTTIRRELSKLRSAAGPIRPMAPDPTPRSSEIPRQWPTATPPPITTKLPPLSSPADSSYERQSPPFTGAQDRSQEVPPPTGFGKRPNEPKAGPSAPSNSAFSNYVSSSTESARTDLEKFIGENLISKIGIVILVLGVGIGAKYAIDNGWISPLMRVVFGYVMGFGLIGFAVRLKTKYLNFSAVLLSGGMAIMYFVTYFAYAAYSLINQPTAFVLMAMFTTFTVASAILYNRQVIAHVGLVGAYAVPFLLSDNSGNYLFLFTYMAIINAGVLAISVRKYWNPIFYTSSVFTWLIFAGWFVTKYSAGTHFYLALTFLGIFFATFYATKIVHGVMRPESKDAENLACILVTAFIFYSFCAAISDVRADDREYSSFFAYLAVMSLGILLTSYRFYGRVLVYLSYPFTWLIFGVWFFSKYRADEHFVLAATFTGVFFAIYYVATLVYRLVTDEIGMIESTGLVLTNSFVFYGLGYAILDSREGLRGFEGLFTVAHSAFHSVVAQAVSRLKASAVDVVQVLTILIITFATIAIPIQFNGNLVTLIWSVEAAALFWFGRARHIPLFEYLSYPIMVLATGSLFIDWVIAYSERTMYVSEFNRQPLANGDFITAIVFVAASAFIYLTNRNKLDEAAIGGDLVRPFGYAVGCVGLVALYNLFRIEIGNYFHLKIASTGDPDIGNSYNPDILWFNVLWQLNYTMFFLSVLGLVNLRKIRSTILANAGTMFSLLSLIVFSTAAMQLFHYLRVSYMSGESGFSAGLMNILIRHISYGFAAVMIFKLYKYSYDEMMTGFFPAIILRLGFDAVFYTTLFISASCELVNLMGQLHIPDALKLGLSVLWGVYALLLIALGIAWNKKHLRIAAFVLLAVTLAKLFFYDIADLPTIPKTILFVSLGLLMLIVSFLYNKYKGMIFKVSATQEDGEAKLP